MCKIKPSNCLYSSNLSGTIHFCRHLQPSCSKWHLKQGRVSKVLRQQSYQICHVQLSFKTPSLNHLDDFLLIKITLSSTTQLTLMLNMWQRRCWDWIWHITNHMWCSLFIMNMSELHNAILPFLTRFWLFWKEASNNSSTSNEV